MPLVSMPLHLLPFLCLSVAPAKVTSLADEMLAAAKTLSLPLPSPSLKRMEEAYVLQRRMLLRI